MTRTQNDFSSGGTTTNSATWVATRHRNEDAEHTAKVNAPSPRFFHRRRSILGVDLTESLDSSWPACPRRRPQGMR